MIELNKRRGTLQDVQDVQSKKKRNETKDEQINYAKSKHNQNIIVNVIIVSRIFKENVWNPKFRN